MRRADRLFEIIQILRQSKGPMTADAIAAELEIGKRTIYRDIAALIAQRVPIRGEAGIGYVMEAGFDLPPLMLKTVEVEAITLGAQWVIANADEDMAHAALAVVAKIAAIVPDNMRPLIDDPTLGTPPRQKDKPSGVNYGRLRQWSREGRKAFIIYYDDAGTETHRMIWPFMVGYFGTLRVLIAWCEMRSDFRIFRTDRIADLTFLEIHYPERSIILRRKWLASKAGLS